MLIIPFPTYPLSPFIIFIFQTSTSPTPVGAIEVCSMGFFSLFLSSCLLCRYSFQEAAGPCSFCTLNVQGNFRHASSNNLVSREELMIILSRLDGLYIRGLYFTETQRLTLGEVGLEEATSAGSGSIAYSVETCSCPPEYAGDSCQVGSVCLHAVPLCSVLPTAIRTGLVRGTG